MRPMGEKWAPTHLGAAIQPLGELQSQRRPHSRLPVLKGLHPACGERGSRQHRAPLKHGRCLGAIAIAQQVPLPNDSIHTPPNSSAPTSFHACRPLRPGLGRCTLLCADRRCMVGGVGVGRPLQQRGRSLPAEGGVVFTAPLHVACTGPHPRQQLAQGVSSVRGQTWSANVWESRSTCLSWGSAPGSSARQRPERRASAVRKKRV